MEGFHRDSHICLMSSSVQLYQERVWTCMPRHIYAYNSEVKAGFLLGDVWGAFDIRVAQGVQTLNVI